MTAPIRMAILAGVSSDVQAREDRASIPDQIATCRRAVEQLGGVEVALYVLDGYSRTGYDSLADAMIDIPPLKEAIEAAGRNDYDVLIMDNFDRLGDLGQLVHTRFKRYRKQLYSARQSGRLYDPADYDPYKDESSAIDIHIQGILQSYRINKLMRGLELGLKKRVEDGRHSRNFPAGYRLDNGSLIRDEPTASLLVRLKDAFLRDGATLKQLAQTANASGIPSPRGQTWHSSTVSRILKNPFYTGKVFNGRWGNSGWHISPAGNRVYRKTLNHGARLLDGVHPPLWTWDEFVYIQDELEQRYKQMPRSRVYTFSGMLVCAKCGKRAEVKRGEYVCRPIHAGGIRLGIGEAAREIGQALAEALRNYQGEEEAPQRVDTSAEAIAAIERQIHKIQRGFETEIYTATEAREKITALRGQIQKIEASKLDEVSRAAAAERMRARKEELLPLLDDLADMLERGEPAKNNRLLRDIVSGIVVGDGTYKFLWR